MTINAADSVKHEWTGTGGDDTITLGAAAVGFQAVPSSLDGKVVGYLIEHQGAGIFERENGFGTYTHSGTTLTRTNVTFSTASNSPVDFSAGTKHIVITLLADHLGEMADQDNAAGNRQNWGQVSLDATGGSPDDGNVEFDGSDPELLVRVHGHTTARNLTITPAPSSSFSARTLLVFNDGTGDVDVLNHSSVSIDTVAAGTVQMFHWASSAWTAGIIWPGGGGGGGGLSGVTTQVLTVGDGTTLTAATHARYQEDDGDLLLTIVRLRHASNQATAVAVTVEDGMAVGTDMIIIQAEDQTGQCTLNTVGSPNVATINGKSSVALLGASSSAILSVTATNTYRLKGDTDEPINVDGAIIAGNRAEVLTSVSGSLTKEAHSGRALVTSGNITVPNASTDIGFNATIIAGGAHTVTFNSLTSPAMGTGDVMTVLVQSTTVIKASLVEAADLVTFS